MDAPHTKDGNHGPGAVDIHHIEGDALFVAGAAPPQIPSDKSRHCPQCDRQAWLLSQHCWYCSFDFASPQLGCGNKLLLLTAVINLAGAITLALLLAANGHL